MSKAATPTAPLRGEALRARYLEVRRQTLALTESLEPEDMLVQSMPDASPTKWHLAHTTWFFERMVLQEHVTSYPELDPAYDFLFNSYYQSVGPMHARPQRGLLSRPALKEVLAYRRHVDEHMQALLEGELPEELASVVELGTHHEQQHQELLLTDIKHAFGASPLLPAFRALPAQRAAATPLAWVASAGGLVEVGHEGPAFAFDNEGPRHKVWLEPFLVASRLVSTREYQAFIDDGGYARPELWLSEGWDTVRREGLGAPAYWLDDGRVFTLGGARARLDEEPVCHVSFFEADAYARWAGARLPSEAEWELMSQGAAADSNFLDEGRLHPRAASGERLAQVLGDVWEWTGSAYAPYPGFRALAGALAEYNGKFMCNQLVLRGGSCLTPRTHLRKSYRNFFPAAARWQMTGIRLARDAA